MRPSPLPILLAALLQGPGGMAQLELHFDGSIPVHRQGTRLDLAWAGGLNFVQASTIDLNGDGLKDLFLFDRSGNKVITLLNTGGTGTAGYTLSRAYDRVPPLDSLYEWALLRDYDRDGKEDLLTYSHAGFAVHKNTSTGGNLSFELVNWQVRSNYVSTSGAPVFANLFVSQVDLPGVVDVDGDGDLDILTFSLLGSYVEYHRNMSMERYGTCDSLEFEVRNKCWGFFSENANDNLVTLNVPCPFNVPNPEIGGGPSFAEGFAKAKPDNVLEKAHSGSSVTPLDLNGDGTMDLLLGDIGFNNLVGLYNGGTVDLAFMTQEDSLFPRYDRPMDMLFPAAFHLDVDKDGRRDLVVGTNATSLVHNFRSLWYYQNVGTDASPVFEFRQEDLFQDRMLDFGEGALPVLFDHDGDGLMDLLVANHGYFQPSGTYRGAIALLRNTGTPTAPAFELVTDDWMGLSNSGIGLSMYPAFADIDGDGDLDMYLGDLQGQVHFYRNIATGPVAQFQLAQPNITDASGNTIDVGQFATPQFTDLDGDGLIDMIVGERNGNLNWYRNTGTAQAPAWTLMSENLGGVSTVEWWNITGHSVPFLFRNTSGDREILLGSESGWLYHYGNIEGNIMGTWTLMDSAFMGLHEGHRTGLCLYDLTNDGKLDMVVGNYRGGLSFWRSDGTTTAGAPRMAAPTGFTLQPNPATGRVELVLAGAPPPGSAWSLCNGLGQEVFRRTAVAQRMTLELDGLAEGVYLVRLEGAEDSAVRRLVVVR